MSPVQSLIIYSSYLKTTSLFLIRPGEIAGTVVCHNNVLSVWRTESWAKKWYLIVDPFPTTSLTFVDFKDVDKTGFKLHGCVVYYFFYILIAVYFDWAKLRTDWVSALLHNFLIF